MRCLLVEELKLSVPKKIETAGSGATGLLMQKMCNFLGCFGAQKDPSSLFCLSNSNKYHFYKFKPIYYQPVYFINLQILSRYFRGINKVYLDFLAFGFFLGGGDKSLIFVRKAQVSFSDWKRGLHTPWVLHEKSVR